MVEVATYPHAHTHMDIAECTSCQVGTMMQWRRGHIGCEFIPIPKHPLHHKHSTCLPKIPQAGCITVHNWPGTGLHRPKSHLIYDLHTVSPDLAADLTLHQQICFKHLFGLHPDSKDAHCEKCFHHYNNNICFYPFNFLQ